MADEMTTEDMIESTQDGMEDHVSFEEANNSLDQKADDDNDGASFDEEEESKPNKDANNDNSEDDGKSEKDESKEVKKEEKSKEQVEAKAKEDQKSKDAKKIMLVDGDSKLEVKPDSKVTVQVDGKPVEMTLQEAINKASGNVAVEKRFSELAIEKNKFKAEKVQYDSEKSDLMNRVGAFAKAVQEEDGLGAIQALSSLTGYNPVELRAHFKELVVNDVKKYLAMSPEQQKEFDMQQERDYHRQEREMREQQDKSREANSDLEKSILQFQAQYGLDNAALVALYDEAEAKSLDVKSAKDLESFHQQKLTQQKSSSLISKVDPSLSQNTEALRIVGDFLAKNPELDDESVIKAIKEAIGPEEKPESKQTSSLSQKIQNKQNKNSTGKTKEFKAPVDDDKELLTFDDIGY